MMYSGDERLKEMARDTRSDLASFCENEWKKLSVYTPASPDNVDLDWKTVSPFSLAPFRDGVFDLLTVSKLSRRAIPVPISRQRLTSSVVPIRKQPTNRLLHLGNSAHFCLRYSLIDSSF